MGCLWGLPGDGPGCFSGVPSLVNEATLSLTKTATKKVLGAPLKGWWHGNWLPHVTTEGRYLNPALVGSTLDNACRRERRRRRWQTAADNYGLGQPSYSKEGMNRRTGQEVAEDQKGGAGRGGAAGRGGVGGAGPVVLELMGGTWGRERSRGGGGGRNGLGGGKGDLHGHAALFIAKQVLTPNIGFSLPCHVSSLCPCVHVPFKDLVMSSIYYLLPPLSFYTFVPLLTVACRVPLF